MLITGTGFQSGAVLWMGGVSMTAVSFINATTLQASTPPSAAGWRDLQVQNPDSQSASLANAFEYKAPTPTPAPGGDPEVKEMQALPNPSSGPDLVLAVKLSAPAEGLRVRLYSAALTCMLDRRVEQALPAGWSQVRLAGHGLAAGLCFAKAQPLKDGKLGKPSPIARFVISR